ncbi:MAG: PKD domain-containing protein [Flavobacteriales bacterium]|nr:PKD domain-containing protein [Flavobacteriales bacterium]
MTFTNCGLNDHYWDWDFGDGSELETMDEPTHVYSDPGTYIIRLFAFSASEKR